MIQVAECHFEVILCFLTNRKCDFLQVDKATIQLVEWHSKVIFCVLNSQNSRLFRSSKLCFKWSPGTGNIFSSS